MTRNQRALAHGQERIRILREIVRYSKVSLRWVARELHDIAAEIAYLAA